jgi:serine/threonine protein kinase
MKSLGVGMEPLPGYRLSRALGSGGFGEVWEAQTPHGRPVALKFLPCDSWHGAAREIRSLQAIRDLRHPHLVHIEQVWCLKECIVVAMELADGSLTDLLDTYRLHVGTPVVPEHACVLLSDAAEALDFLNTRQHWVNGRRVAIQHCDVKPGNLLLVGDVLKVADFGLSSLLGSQLEARPRAGTLDYCAPEVFQGLVSASTDQYALAVTYCMLRGGRLPFRDTPRYFDPHYVRPAPDLTMLGPEERPILARALSRVPQDRWPSCRALFAGLSELFCQSLENGFAKGKPARGGAPLERPKPNITWRSTAP